MIEQLAMELEELGLTNNNTSIKSTHFLKTNKIVFVYIIENLVSQKKYVGISSEPLSRISSHLNGGGSTELFKEHKLKQSDFEFRVLESFVDNDFTPSNTQSVAYHVEALMIAFYDSIRSGYNFKYYIKSDFTDEKFWMSILPDNFKKYYINSNKVQLNINIANHIPKHINLKMNNNSSRCYDIRVDNLYRKRIFDLIDKKVLVFILAKELCNIHRSQLSRFLRGYGGALKTVRIASLIEKIEDHLDVAHRFDIKKELIDNYGFE